MNCKGKLEKELNAQKNELDTQKKIINKLKEELKTLKEQCVAANLEPGVVNYSDDVKRELMELDDMCPPDDNNSAPQKEDVEANAPAAGYGAAQEPAGGYAVDEGDCKTQTEQQKEIIAALQREIDQLKADLGTQSQTTDTGVVGDVGADDDMCEDIDIDIDMDQPQPEGLVQTQPEAVAPEPAEPTEGVAPDDDMCEIEDETAPQATGQEPAVQEPAAGYGATSDYAAAGQEPGYGATGGDDDMCEIDDDEDKSEQTQFKAEEPSYNQPQVGAYGAAGDDDDMCEDIDMDQPQPEQAAPQEPAAGYIADQAHNPGYGAAQEPAGGYGAVADDEMCEDDDAAGDEPAMVETNQAPNDPEDEMCEISSDDDNKN